MRHLDRANLRYPGLWRGCIGAWAPRLGPSGTTLRDWSGRNNHGTLTNMDAASDWVVSGGEYSIEFDGSNDYISHTLPIGGLFQVGLSCWFLWVAYASNDDLLFEYTPNTNLGGNRGFIINPNSGSSFAILVSEGGSPYNGGTIPRPSAGAWHHMAVNFDRTRGTANNIDVWVDGVSQTVTQTQTGNITTSFATSNLYWASRAGTTLFGNTFIDEVRVYNRLLNGSDVSLLSRRRGIAYETTRNRSYKAAAAGFRPAWASQRTQMIGGGIR